MKGFVAIPKYNGKYLINKQGDVFSTVKNRLLKPTISVKGYLILTLNKKTRYLHQLLAETFIDEKYKIKKLVVDHIDKNPLNNSLENLRIVNKSINGMNVNRKIGNCIFARKDSKYKRFCVIIQKHGTRYDKSFKKYTDALSYRNKLAQKLSTGQ